MSTVYSRLFLHSDDTGSTQIATNTADFCGPAQVLAHTSPRSRSNVGQLLIEAEAGKRTDSVTTILSRKPEDTHPVTYPVHFGEGGF